MGPLPQYTFNIVQVDVSDSWILRLVMFFFVLHLLNLDSGLQSHCTDQLAPGPHVGDVLTRPPAEELINHDVTTLKKEIVNVICEIQLTQFN